MDNLETSIKYGVTTPETSRKLDWKEKTLFYWVEGDESVFNLQPLVYIDAYGDSQSNWGKVIPAPQMHEIFPHLEGDGNADFLIDGDTLWYDCNDDEANQKYGEIQAFIYDNHIAEACAEIYIQLRNNNLLWKSPETNS